MPTADSAAALIPFTGSSCLRFQVRVSLLELQPAHLGHARRHVLHLVDEFRLVDVARLQRDLADAELHALGDQVLHRDLERVAVLVLGVAHEEVDAVGVRDEDDLRLGIDAQVVAHVAQRLRRVIDALVHVVHDLDRIARRGRCHEGGYGERGAGKKGADHVMVASSVRLSPLLSTHVITTLSPGLPPENRNDRNGFFETAGPHSAESTVLPLCVAVTFWMNHAGIVAPLASLRCPVSISWLINTLTSTLSPAIWARIFIGSAMA